MAKKKNPDVGYGRPPVQHQFKPGQSGNPRGRPRGRLGMVGLLKKALNERVTITEGGRKRTITMAEAAFKQTARKAVSGDMRATSLLWALIQFCESRSTDAVARYDTDADQAVMAELSARFQQTLNEIEGEGT